MKIPLRLALLYAADGKSTIIAAMHYNSAGIYYEQEMPVVLDDAEHGIAEALQAALDRFSFREANLRERRSTDAPSYRASGLKSMRDFERTYLRVVVGAVNEAELFYRASVKPYTEKDITLSVMLNRYGPHDQTTKLLGKLIAHCAQWREL